MTPGRGRVFLVGAGPGDPGLMTIKGARALATADVVIYDRLAAPQMAAFARTSCESVNVGKGAGAHRADQTEITALLVRLGLEGRRVVRLKGGDPLVFGRGAEEAVALFEAGVPFEIIPGVSSATAVPAYAGIPLTHRAHSSAFTVMTGHEAPGKACSSLDFSRLANPGQTLVVLMALANLRAIAANLHHHGLPSNTPAAVVQEGTLPAQRTVIATLATVADEVERARLRAPAVVVFGNVVRERERMRWFDSPPSRA